ncbi:unnamed protein product [Didymodactylos carnosus]|uniref:TIR domain-containing protein n=1 Tax=Didymodactylos carnosus TaxID=1234261 RepID=A0A8S2HGU4_9BILA|nr:unnamed protein product [Didymodactylos carnosus]CAF3631188.1 unnamed protein product [Didymodactylos carnosus]
MSEINDNNTAVSADVTIDFCTIFNQLEQILLKYTDYDCVIPFIDRLSTKLTPSFVTKVQQTTTDKTKLELIHHALEKLIHTVEIGENINSFVLLPHLLVFLQIVSKLSKDIDLYTFFPTDVEYAEKANKSYLELTNSNQLQKYLHQSAQSRQQFFDNLLNILLPILTYSSVSLLLCKDKNIEICKSSLESFREYLENDDQLRSSVSNEILRFLKVLSKKTVLISLFIDCQYPELCLKWIRTVESSNQFNLSSETLQYILCILHNISRDYNGSQVLNDLKAIEVIEKLNDREILSYLSENEYWKIQLPICMTVSLLVDPERLKNCSRKIDDRLKEIFNQLVETIVKASQTSIYVYNCFHISEPLTVFAKLFINDIILEYVLTHCQAQSMSVLDFFCQLLIQFHLRDNSDRLPKLSLCNILWSISFHDKYKESLKNNGQLMKLIQTLSNVPSTESGVCNQEPHQCIPKYLSSIKKACEGILWNVADVKLLNTPPLITATQSQWPLAMISYSHIDLAFCQELVKKIHQMTNELDMWVDFQHNHSYVDQDSRQHSISHSDDIWEEIANAIEIASVIIVIISKDYYDSKACRQELSYATDTLKKRIIPIYSSTVPTSFKPSGWLGIRIAGQNFVHFGKKHLDANVTELISMVKDQEHLSSQPSKTLVHQDNVVEENEYDIHQWFSTNQIHPNIEMLFSDLQTMSSLVLYAKHLKSYYKQEYDSLSEKYKQRYNKPLDTVQFIVFVDALFRLHNEINYNVGISTKPDQNLMVFF